MLIAWKATLHVLSCKAALQCSIFIHGHVPTWIKDSSLFNNLLSLRKMFWLASHGLAMLALKRPPVHSCVHAGPTPVKAVIRGSSLWRWFIHKRASFNYSQIRPHGYPGGAAALQRQCAIRSEPRVTSQTTHRSPTALHSREQDFNLQCSHQRDFRLPGVSELA